MQGRSHLSDLDREFSISRKEYLAQVENTARLMKADTGFDLEAAVRQRIQERLALERYLLAYSALEEASAAMRKQDEEKRILTSVKSK